MNTSVDTASKKTNTRASIDTNQESGIRIKEVVVDVRGKPQKYVLEVLDGKKWIVKRIPLAGKHRGQKFFVGSWSNQIDLVIKGDGQPTVIESEQKAIFSGLRKLSKIVRESAVNPAEPTP